MQLSPLQSRLAASIAASMFVLALYLLLLAPNVALAADLPIPADILLERPPELSTDLQPSYEPDFPLFDRGIVGRAAAGSIGLRNNQAEELNLEPGSTACYVFEKSTIFGDEKTNDARGTIEERQDSTKTIYVTGNTCLQPGSEKTKDLPPQLALYMSVSGDGCATPSKDYSKDLVQDFEQGAAMWSRNVTGDVYITVAAPNVTSGFSGVYYFEVAASVDDYFHRVDSSDKPELLWLDSDSDSALLVSRNITENKDETGAIMSQKSLPYSLYVDNEDFATADGVRHSTCGLVNYVSIKGNANGDGTQNHIVDTVLSTRGVGGFPKQQFFLEGLNSSSNYTGIMVSDRNGTKPNGVVGGGGTVFNGTSFDTRSTQNCQLVYDLDFCNETQYTTPGDESRFNTTALGKLYDDYARKMYANFEKVMMQIPCETGSTSAYSLARNCDDCKVAYKRWLCLVTIPRCEDYSYNNAAAVMRNAGSPFPNGTKLPDDIRQEYEKSRAHNTSRNAWIDETLQPGPYKEILPCEDICYEVVQSCPAAIGFTCPRPHMSAFSVSYGQRRGDDSTTSCNYPGEARTPIGAGGMVQPRMMILGTVALAAASMLS